VSRAVTGRFLRSGFVLSEIAEFRMLSVVRRTSTEAGLGLGGGRTRGSRELSRKSRLLLARMREDPHMLDQTTKNSSRVVLLFRRLRRARVLGGCSCLSESTLGMWCSCRAAFRWGLVGVVFRLQSLRAPKDFKSNDCLYKDGSNVRRPRVL
jgi:hypothetical protein